MKAGAAGFALTLVGLVVALSGCEGSAGAAGSSCTVVANADMTSTIRCTDGTMVTVRNGGPGTPGGSCTVRDGTMAGTKIIECDDGTMVTVADGDSASCTVTPGTTPGTEVITCNDGTMATVSNGDPGRSCTVRNGPDAGTRVITCDDGTSVTVSDGASADNFRVTQFHGEDALLSSGEYAGGAKTLVNAVITAATADAAGVVTVDFRVETRDTPAVPVTNVASISATVAKLVPPGTGEASNHWVPYIWRTETVSGSASGDWPNPDGTTAQQGATEGSASTATPPPPLGTLTNNDDGTYRYVFVNHLGATMSGTTPITYERNLTHRVVVMMGGHSGPTADATFDFVPDGAAVTETRSIVETATCQQCHNRNEFHGHGGNRLSVETCAVCHVPGATDAQSGNSLELKVMIHRIHAGGEMGGMAGPDGILWDLPTTTANEQADNLDYSIWGNRNRRNTWWKVGFPAVLDNCAKCHTGSGAQVGNFHERPSRAACGSCHSDVDFATGTNHGGGVRTDDSGCTICHGATAIDDSHDFMTRDPRNVPEFNATLTVNTPTRGYFIAGEAPIVTIALRDATTDAVIAGTSVVEDPTAETCPTPYSAATCAARDGLFRAAAFFVHGPRGRNVPVLTTAARAQVLSTGTGPFDISAAGASLVLKIDGGRDIHRTDATGGDYLAVGNVTVNVSAGTFVSTAAATTDEIVTWLNANTAFNRRAIAFNQAGRVGIRSRNLGWIYSVQLSAGAVTTAVFGGDVAAHLTTGFTPANTVSARTTPANNDPKATRNAADITYQLDPVDDLAPGTYIAQIEFSDRGRTDATNYWAPTVAFANIQVGTATEEAPIARSCNTCHQSDTTGFGTGFVVDVSRHNKYLRDLATDQCGGCHDQMPQNGTSAGGGSNGWTGSRPISRRVHGIHFGSSLNYPLLTVDYSNGDPLAGRNWDITLPQDVRNCETCHTDSTSGTWATRPARLPCSGCHDSDAATGHMRIMTFDPTPTDPWSGDEIESCQTCH